MGFSSTRSLQGPRLGSDSGPEPQAWPLTCLAGLSWDQQPGLAAPDVAHASQQGPIPWGFLELQPLGTHLTFTSEPPGHRVPFGFSQQAVRRLGPDL